MKRDDDSFETIDIEAEAAGPSEPSAPGPGERTAKRFVLTVLTVVFVALGIQVGGSVYLDVLWFDTLGFRSVFTETLKLKVMLFIGFGLATLVWVKLAFWLLAKLAGLTEGGWVLRREGGRVAVERVPLGGIGWVVGLVLALVYGLKAVGSWTRYATFLHQPATTGSDPIFGKPLGWYLFTLPLQLEWLGWLWMLAVTAFIASWVVYVAGFARETPPKHPTRGVSLAFAFLLGVWAWDVYLSRFTLLLGEHTVFTGVNYTDAHVRLPGLLILTICFGMGAALAALNALSGERFRLLVLAGFIPLAVSVVAEVVIPSYVTTFQVKPNELAYERPYIEHNIKATRDAFKLTEIEEKPFEVEFTADAFDFKNTAATLDNVQIWDWRALKATLKQLQEIRTYYDFHDVDIDRYTVNGQTRHMLLAARELDTSKLPANSRNWINEHLIYTHGYGVTMNPVNKFTGDGQPDLVLADMPVRSKVPEIKVTRPEIYFGELGGSHVYVKTKQKEFNYPQGDTNEATVYEGQGGIRVGSGLRRLLIAMHLGELTKIPFSDDITPDSLVMMRRNIFDRVHRLTPYLGIDEDPYVVIGADGKLYWMMDGYTASATYPYARHFNVQVNGGSEAINYYRNSVKIVIDAYEGTVNYYVCEPNDPVIQAYRGAFPTLFRDFDAMPADLRAHTRFPERMMAVQGEVHSLYHMDDPQVFFNREDQWSVATELRQNEKDEQAAQHMEPYFALMQLPNEKELEFISILPFTPAGRNNLIAWMGGRSDGAHYGKLIVYTLPKTKLIDGPQQVEARIDQNAFLSGQLTLWNQQGSKVLRGHMVVVPLGKSLMYAEPIYLQAANSPMPELRLVVLASQEHLAYGTSFEEALRNLTTQLGGAPPTDAGTPTGAPPQTGTPSGSASRDELIKRAADDLEAYQKLMAQGKFGEAGQKLESLKRSLDELRKGEPRK